MALAGGSITLAQGGFLAVAALATVYFYRVKDTYGVDYLGLGQEFHRKFKEKLKAVKEPTDPDCGNCGWCE